MHNCTVSQTDRLGLKSKPFFTYVKIENFGILTFNQDRVNQSDQLMPVVARFKSRDQCKKSHAAYNESDSQWWLWRLKAFLTHLLLSRLSRITGGVAYFVRNRCAIFRVSTGFRSLKKWPGDLKNFRMYVISSQDPGYDLEFPVWWLISCWNRKLRSNFEQRQK